MYSIAKDCSGLYELARFDGQEWHLVARGSYQQMNNLKASHLRFEAWLEERGLL